MENTEIVWFGFGSDHAIIITPDETPEEVLRELEDYARGKGARCIVRCGPVEADDLGGRLITAADNVRSEAPPMPM